jgi:hypothetical protein
VPSVFHIRYAGQIKRLNGNNSCHICKGVFLVDHRNNATYEMNLRISMLKESVSESCASVLGSKLGIIGLSKESPGRLSQQLICLLTASIPDQVLLDIQQEQLHAVDNATIDPLCAAWLAGLEPKAAPWNAFQALLLSIARDHRAKVSSADSKEGPSTNGKEETVAAPVVPPALYSTCTIGRDHLRHLSDNLTKVQVPLASCRTLFGGAFPETLSCRSAGFSLSERVSAESCWKTDRSKTR